MSMSNNISNAQGVLDSLRFPALLPRAESEVFKSAKRTHRFTSVVDVDSDPHLNGEYFRRNPTWHVEHSAWKAENVLKMLAGHQLEPRTVCDVGCGAGEVLRRLRLGMRPRGSSPGGDGGAPAGAAAEARAYTRRAVRDPP